MKSRAAVVDNLDSSSLSDYEDAWQGIEAWVEKSGVEIDAMDEIRGYIDSILKAQVEAKTETVSLSMYPEKTDSTLDHAQVQAQGGLAALINLSVLSSLLLAQQTKDLVKQKRRED